MPPARICPAVLLALLLLPATSAQTGQAVPEMAHYDAALADLFDEYAIPGAAVAVAKDGRLVYARGFGLADVEGGVAVEPNARFRIASISKPITAVAVMTLVEDGLLGLDDPAFSFLEDLPAPDGQTEDPRLAQVTIRDLLQHSGGWDSGSTGYDPMFDAVRIAQAMGTPPPADVEATVRYMRGRPLDFDPGARYAYSNFGYAVLGRIIERVSGQAYEDYVLSVLAETGVNRMALGGSLLDDRLPGEVRYYEYNGATTPSVFPPHPTVPWPYGGFHLEAMDAHGAWVASAPDLLRFMEAVDGRPGRLDVLSEQSIQAMTARPDVPTWASTSYWYGLGWLVNQFDNWWHDGSLPGTRTYLIRTAYEGLSYAVLANTRPEPDNGFFAELDDVLWQAATSTTSWPTHDLFGQFVATEGGAGAPDFALAVAPNPVRGAAVLSLTLPEAGAVTVAVYDVLGREVLRLQDSPLTAGTHELRLDLSGAPAGVYVVRATTPGGAAVGRITVVR